MPSFFLLLEAFERCCQGLLPRIPLSLPLRLDCDALREGRKTLRQVSDPLQSPHQTQQMEEDKGTKNARKKELTRVLTTSLERGRVNPHS
jgi:hypothetical protein